MKIETLKDLEAMLKVCRKQGVTSIEVDSIKLVLLEAPEPKVGTVSKDDVKTPDTYSDEDMLFWSSDTR